MSDFKQQSSSEASESIRFIKVPKILGLLIILFGIAHTTYYLNFIYRAERIDATTVESRYLPSIRATHRYSSGVRAGYQYTLEFTNRSGQIVTADIATRSLRATSGSGGKLEILYMPDSSPSIRENTWLKTWGTGVIIVFGGLLFWTLTVYVMKSHHKWIKKSGPNISLRFPN